MPPSDTTHDRNASRGGTRVPRVFVLDVVDNSAMKHGQRLYGTNLQVQSPAVLRGLQQPVVVMRAGAYEAEIKAGILREHNPGTIFV